MAFATVYNTLSALTRVGHVRSLAFGGATRFDPNTAPHDHAICDACGAIMDVAPRGRRGPAPEGLAGFRIEKMERIYRGRCAECAKEPTHKEKVHG
jgi:Fur family peroxide stress response transcriptional regulator